MGGAGGYVGSVQNQFESTVHEGYATVGTDAGHTAIALMAGWALRNDRRIADYGHRAVHRTAEVTKALIVAYYGRPPEHSYFIGCSNGGREALMEAQRYPADFDGIVAIAPSFNFLEFTAAFVRNLQAQYPTGVRTSPMRRWIMERCSGCWTTGSSDTTTESRTPTRPRSVRMASGWCMPPGEVILQDESCPSAISTSKGAMPHHRRQHGEAFGEPDAHGAIRWMLEQYPRS
jgi:pimeloyl-ACP methyl ester carboxylesterase